MRDASYRDTNFLEVISRGGPRVRAVEFERLGERDPERIQQLLARVLLTVDARNLFDPANPVVAGLLYDGGVFRHGCMLAGDVVQNHGIPASEVAKILRIVEERRGEIEEQWRDHRRR